MSHIGNKLRMGFFATPEEQGNYLRQLLSFTGDASILDPTAGEGDILKQLTKDQSHQLTTYAVELDDNRFEKAKAQLDHVVHAPLESMVVSNESFSLLYLNPPYDFEMKGEDGKAERKEHRFLLQSSRYLAKHGILIYVIPSYRFSDKRIARFLATNFDNVGLMKFSSKDYDDFKQAIFIGRKKSGKRKVTNQKLLDFLLRMDEPTFVDQYVTPIDVMVSANKTWKVPSGKTSIDIFYSRLESKSEYIEDMLNSKGFHAFKERTKPKALSIGGDPIINIPQGQMALLLASGAINGLIGHGDKLHAVQGMEIVSKETTEEKKQHESGSTSTKSVTRTKRDISVKVITPNGLVKKFV